MLSRPLKSQISICICIILFTAIIVMWTTFVFIYRKNTGEQTAAVYQQSLESIGQNITFLQETIYGTSTYLILNQNTQDILQFPESKLLNMDAAAKSKLDAASLLSFNTLVSNDYVSFVSFTAKNGYTLYVSRDGGTEGYPYEQIRNAAPYEQAAAKLGAPIWMIIPQDSTVVSAAGTRPKLALIRAVMNTNTYKPEGFLTICVDFSTIQEAFFAESSQKSRQTVFFITEGGTVLGTAETPPTYTYVRKRNGETSIIDPQSVSAGEYVRFNGETCIVAKYHIKSCNAYIIGLTRITDAMQNMNNVLILFLISAVCILLIFTFAAVFSGKLITNPLNRLLESITAAKEGNFSRIVDIRRTDEIGTLANEYNSLMNKLNYQINTVYRLQISEREAELKALVSQINPHFLYNTLDTIYWKCLNAGEKDVSSVIYSLSRLFRLTLNRGNELTYVKNEIELISHYVKLQKTISHNRFDFQPDIDETVYDFLIPKLILQPFVENAIVHAACNTSYTVTVSLCGTLTSEGIFFLIGDNGTGIDPAVLNSLLTDSNVFQDGSERKGSSNYAIKNIRERLKLYYGNTYTLTISSDPGTGTRIELTLPFEPVKQETGNAHTFYRG
ncbi:integral membrane sensor signal transduction histidine kinase [Treponema brennaborense DSM 12168]|uniref:Integral membrane sensor signal transduction histidine kinase n=1 Tax=Treponema brennaborense (strain DSM 12168 / CIP 105900 / DD5/3) TaxID=906968 RepID=F4LMY3_TREBD|nr:integral membrane sensor signal transduction histidine kinase [Treponema brennaborense DSM 12168]